MTEVNHPLELSSEDERSLRSLIRAVERANGQFALKLVHCNYRELRVQVMQRLRQDCGVAIQELTLLPSTRTLSAAITERFPEEELSCLPALVIHGLEQVKDLEGLLSAANQVRDTFHQRFPFPLVLWVTDDVSKAMIRTAPDFSNWASGPIRFRPSAGDLTEFLRSQTQQLWSSMLHPKGDLFPELPDASETSALPLRYREVEAAQRDLEADGHVIDDSLRAGLELALGRDAFLHDNVNQATHHYQESLESLQVQQEGDRVGLVMIHLGRCSWRKAELDRLKEKQHWRDAARHFHAGLTAFESADYTSLKARFIGDLGETLKQLGEWESLQTLIEKALVLHNASADLKELARDYGLKATLHLQRENYTAAQDAAQEALQLLGQAPHQPEDESGILLLLAQAQAQLGQIEEAIAHLETAKRQVASSKNPRLYIAILNQLRERYFEQKDYCTAFECKRDRLVIESQYGFRAFIGAGRLRPQRFLTVDQDDQDTIAPEIAVSGRQIDVDRLRDRIASNRHRLTILHGPLGVGKSSILQAGLIPALHQQRIETRRVMTVLMRTYTNCQWSERLGEKLSRQLQDVLGAEANISLQSPGDILEQLQHNQRGHHLATVLIFDQFEEFFFNCKEANERRRFFEFLSACLNIPFVNVILSLREDYLHYLLEWEKYGKAQHNTVRSDRETLIQQDVLKKEHRCELGNFSPDDTRKILKTLTKRAQFSLEPELLDCLVQDLVTANQDVKPIELQVIGFQLQVMKITTLEQYQNLGDNRQEVLIQGYLDNVVQDCGPENRKAANLILYVLTDENNTRPPKTRQEMETDLKALQEDLLKEVSQLELILHIFQKSGLIFLIPERPFDRYQLVHDYLVSFIRAKQPYIKQIVSELKAQREKLIILELEKDLEKKVHEAEKSKLVKTSKTVLITVLSLAVLSVTSFIAFTLGHAKSAFVHNEDIYERELDELRLAMATLLLDSAENSLAFDTNPQQSDKEFALVNTMKAADIFLHNKMISSLSDQERKRAITLFQRVFKLLRSDAKYQKKSYLFDSVIFQGYDNPNSDQLNLVLNESMNRSCIFISADAEAKKALNKRQGKVDLC